MVFESQFDLNEVQDLIESELCHQNGLLKDAFPVTHRILYKQGNPCGVFFCLHGPRSVRLTAVWDLDTSRALLYDSKGHRVCSLALSEILTTTASEKPLTNPS